MSLLRSTFSAFRSVESACGMIDPATDDSSSICATCGAVPFGERFVQMQGRVLNVFCSDACLAAALREQSVTRRAGRLRALRRLTIVVVFAGACLTPHQWPPNKRPARAPKAPPSVASADKATLRTLQPGWFGPEWPPTEM